MCISVREFQHHDQARWDEFARSHPLGSTFHQIGWKKTIEDNYSHRPRYLLAERSGRIEAILPLFLVKNFLAGKALISSPYAVYGGVLANSDEARDALRDSVRELGRQLGVGYVELRNVDERQSLGFQPIRRYVTFRQDLSSGPEKLLAGIPRKTRRMVRKSIKGSLETVPAPSLDAFFDLYSRSLRRLGTPCFPRGHFESILRHFPDQVELREIHFEGQPVAAVLSFLYRDEIHPFYGASDPAYNRLATNNFMYFDLMRWAHAQGRRWFDFGRSRIGSGSYEFKAHWGMEEVALPYEMLLVKRKELPHLSPANPRFKLAIAVWQRLPLGLTRAVGPHLIELVP